MVRLKVLSSSRLVLVSRFQFLMVRLKVNELNQRIGYFPAFQFLMVRLKVALLAKFNRFKSFQFLMVRLKASSIPITPCLVIFQFLMVRLKGQGRGTLKTSSIDFNSLWFD